MAEENDALYKERERENGMGRGEDVIKPSSAPSVSVVPPLLIRRGIQIPTHRLAP